MIQTLKRTVITSALLGLLTTSVGCTVYDDHDRNRSGRSDRTSRLDLDRDGRVEQWERNRVDRDGDGRVEQWERNRLDRDGDGRVERWERDRAAYPYGRDR